MYFYIVSEGLTTHREQEKKRRTGRKEMKKKDGIRGRRRGKGGEEDKRMNGTCWRRERKGGERRRGGEVVKRKIK